MTLSMQQRILLSKYGTKLGIDCDRKGYVSLSKSFNSLVQIVPMMMKILNYNSSFLYPHDKHSKEEEILPHPHSHSNLHTILYYI
jgi:hypothetical protein